jgi:hypothetical protein
MTQQHADAIKDEFERLTDLTITATFMQSGTSHKPTALQSGTCGVYVFMYNEHCFKVGKAGPKSKARWNSHHYNLDETTPSTLPKSILKDRSRFKTFFPIDLHHEIDSLDKSNIQAWIRDRLSRIEFLIKDMDDSFALTLLEALAQFRLKPKFEGRNA